MKTDNCMLCSHVLSEDNLSSFSSTKAGKMKEWKQQRLVQCTMSSQAHDTEAGKISQNVKQYWIEKGPYEVKLENSNVVVSFFKKSIHFLPGQAETYRGSFT